LTFLQSLSLMSHWKTNTERPGPYLRENTSGQAVWWVLFDLRQLVP
jgi:hypothetical protein